MDRNQLSDDGAGLKLFAAMAALVIGLYYFMRREKEPIQERSNTKWPPQQPLSVHGIKHHHRPLRTWEEVYGYIPEGARIRKTPDDHFTVSFAGSHFDGARVNKPDEFDLDVVIRMPVNYSWTGADSDVNFHPQDAGYLQLRMGSQFRNLPKRDGASWEINKTAYLWKDEDHYLSRAKFMHWFKMVIINALNLYDEDQEGNPIRVIDGLEYKIEISESGPAITFMVENEATGFKMDFDLVPALRFPEARWPVGGGYRAVPPRCAKDYWLVVPKPDPRAPAAAGARCWRCSLQNQERQLIHGRDNLKQALRLMKKFRDVKGLHEIASYYIKILFYWEIVEQEEEPLFWRQNPGDLFIIMLRRLYDALDKQNIPYFWNVNNNLIANVDKSIIFEYKKIVSKLMFIISIEKLILRSDWYTMVSQYLLTASELADFRERFPDLFD